jgi:hypothetical protein
MAEAHQAQGSSTVMAIWMALWASLFGMGCAWAQIYTWTDRQGGVHFTDNPSHIPAEYRSSARVERVNPATTPVAPHDDATKDASTGLAVPDAPTSSIRNRDRLGRGPDYWRAAAQQWSARLQQHRQERERLQVLANYTRQLANATRDVWDRGRLEAEATRLEAALTEVEAHIKEAETMLQTTLPLEAVQLGADPEWLKPPVVTQP